MDNLEYELLTYQGEPQNFLKCDSSEDVLENYKNRGNSINFIGIKKTGGSRHKVLKAYLLTYNLKNQKPC